MAKDRSEDYAWARGLGSAAVRLTVGLFVVMALLVVAVVWLLKDTPPVNAAVHHDTESGMDGLLVAEVTIGRDCITVRDESGQVWVPVFPSSDIRLKNDAIVYAGDEFRTGEAISLPGGEAAAAASEWRLPKECPPGPFWVVAP